MKKKLNKEELNPNDGGQGQLLQCVIELAARAAELEYHELSIILFIAALRMAIQKGLDPEEIKKLLKKDLELDEDL